MTASCVRLQTTQSVAITITPTGTSVSSTLTLVGTRASNWHTWGPVVSSLVFVGVLALMLGSREDVVVKNGTAVIIKHT